MINMISSVYVGACIFCVFIYPCCARSLCELVGAGAAAGVVGVVCTRGERDLADEWVIPQTTGQVNDLSDQPAHGREREGERVHRNPGNSHELQNKLTIAIHSHSILLWWSTLTHAMNVPPVAPSLHAFKPNLTFCRIIAMFGMLKLQ